MSKVYLTAEELAEAMGISRSYAYVLIRECNNDLQKQGYICIAGKAPIQYFREKYYGFDKVKIKGKVK